MTDIQTVTRLKLETMATTTNETIVTDAKFHVRNR